MKFWVPLALTDTSADESATAAAAAAAAAAALSSKMDGGEAARTQRSVTAWFSMNSYLRGVQSGNPTTISVAVKTLLHM